MKKDTKETFVEKAKEKHGDKYCYDLVKYVNSKTLVEIICNECRELFWQLPYNHLQGKECLPCATKKRADTKETFVEKAKEKHGDKYCYDSVKYVNSKTLVEIICNECHGPLWQKPQNHTSGDGCLPCANKKRADTEETFIEKAKEKHGDKYCYDSVKYVNSRTPVEIICKECHEPFLQRPYNHTQGYGCPLHKSSKGELAILEFFKRRGLKDEKDFFREHKTKTCRIDFVLPKEKLLIEYNGRQHYIPVSFGSKQKDAPQKKLEINIKNDYKRIRFCTEKEGYYLLIIPYWDFKNINQILNDYLKGKNPTFSEPPPEVRKHKKLRAKIRKELDIVEEEILCGVVGSKKHISVNRVLFCKSLISIQ